MSKDDGYSDMTKDQAWHDAHSPEVDMIVRLETAALRAENHDLRVERDFARGILVDGVAKAYGEPTDKRHGLRAV